MKNKDHLTEQDVANLLTGANTGANAEAAAQPGADEAAAQAAAAAAAAAAEAAVAAEAQANADAAAAAAAGTKGGDKADAQIVDFLKGQVKERDEALVAANVQVNTLTAERDGMKVAHDGLLGIARNVLANMTVALGGSAKPEDFASLDATALLAQHTVMVEKFQKRFPVGGVASAKPEDKKSAAGESHADSMDAARLNAVRLRKK